MSLQHEGGMKRNSHLGRCEAGVCQVSLLHGAHEGVIDSSTGQSSAGKLGLIVFFLKKVVDRRDEELLQPERSCQCWFVLWLIA